MNSNNNNNNNNDKDLKDPIGSNQTTKNDYNYLIKPVSLKTVKKISVAPSLTELDSFIGSTRPDLSSLLSPTNSTTSSQSFFFPSNNNFNSNYNNKLFSGGVAANNTGEGYSNLKKSLIASNPAFTRFYNTPPPTPPVIKPLSSSSSNFNSNYNISKKLEAQRLASNKYKPGSQGLTKVYYSTDHEEEEDLSLQANNNKFYNPSYSSLKLFQSHNHNYRSTSSSSKHNISRLSNSNYNSNSNSRARAYYSATESFGEESDYYPSEYESCNNNYNAKKSKQPYNNINNNNNNNHHEHNLLGANKSSTNNLSIRRNQLLTNSLLNKNFNQSDTTANEENPSSSSSRVSYASITLRQPLKDINYFSDTEALHSGVHQHNNNYKGFRLRGTSSSNCNLHNNHNQHNLGANTSNANTSLDKLAINRASSLAYRNLSTKSNKTQSSNATSYTSVEQQNNNNNYKNLNNNNNNNNNQINSCLSESFSPSVADNKSFNFDKTNLANQSMASLSTYMKMNMLPEYPAHGNGEQHQQQPPQLSQQYSNKASYNITPKGFVSNSGSQFSLNSQQTYNTNSGGGGNSMPIKWAPAAQTVQQQQQQPIAAVSPNPAAIYAQSLAQMQQQQRQQQNEYYEEMQRSMLQVYVVVLASNFSLVKRILYMRFQIY